MKELINNMSVFNTKAYNFSKWLKRQGKVKVTFYSNLPSVPGYYAGKEEHLSIDLDSEDIEYFKNKYVLSELEYKKEELKETLDKVEQLRKQINYIEENKNYVR